MEECIMYMARACHVAYLRSDGGTVRNGLVDERGAAGPSGTNARPSRSRIAGESCKECRRLSGTEDIDARDTPC